jgi:hypothetical protein
VLPILGHEQHGDHYLIEYELQAPVESLPDCFARMYWLERLAFVRHLLGVYETIRNNISAPLGLHAGTIVASRIGAGWEAFLALCPALDLATADELIHVHPWVLSGIAPERLRGTVEIAAQEDIYAAGVLVLLALGAKPTPDLSGEDAVESQACAVFLKRSPECSDVEPALRKIPYIATRLDELEHCASRCTHFTSAARPVTLAELERACAQILILSNAETFTDEVELQANEGDALRFLEWAIARGDDSAGIRQKASRYCEKMGQASRELQHLEKLAALRPWDESTRRRRWQLRYDAYLSRPPRADAAPDTEGEWLIKELHSIRLDDIEGLDDETRAQVKEDYLNAAMIYGLRGDLYGKAKELYEMRKLDFTDIEALLLYGLSLRELAEKEELPLESRNKARVSLEQLLHAVEDRASRLELAGFINKEAVTTWIEMFKALLLS